MSARFLSRRFLLAGVGLSAALLAGCGKKNAPSPPEGEEDNYTYPGIYPAPSSQAPVKRTPPARQNEPSALSPFPDSRTTPTRTYGSS